MTPTELHRKRIAVLMGGRSAEREVSLQSGDAIAAALERRGYQPIRIDVDRDLAARLLREGIEVAFVALHGRWGEDGCVQGMLEMLDIPYTGSGVCASAMAMDKVVSKQLFEKAGLVTAAWDYPAARASLDRLGVPLVIKPRREGSSVGVSIVRHPEELGPALELARDPMAERYVPGHELSVGVIGRGAEASVLGSVEIKAALGHYDYEAKYESDRTQYRVPAPVPEATARHIEQTALRVHRLLGCRGATRVDFRWDGEDLPQVLEINTIPGMTSHSLLPMVAAQAGLSYDDLAERLLEGAMLEAGV